MRSAVVSFLVQQLVKNRACLLQFAFLQIRFGLCRTSRVVRVLIQALLKFVVPADPFVCFFNRGRDLQFLAAQFGAEPFRAPGSTPLQITVTLPVAFAISGLHHPLVCWFKTACAWRPEDANNMERMARVNGGFTSTRLTASRQILPSHQKRSKGKPKAGASNYLISPTIPPTQWSHPPVRREKPVSDYERQPAGS